MPLVRADGRGRPKVDEVRRQGDATPLLGRGPRNAAGGPALVPFLAPTVLPAKPLARLVVLASVPTPPLRVAIRGALPTPALLLAVPKGTRATRKPVPVPKPEAAATQGAHDGPPAAGTPIGRLRPIVHARPAAATATKAPQARTVRRAEAPSGAGTTVRLPTGVDLPIRPRPERTTRTAASRRHPPPAPPRRGRQQARRPADAAPQGPTPPALLVVGASRPGTRTATAAPASRGAAA